MNNLPAWSYSALETFKLCPKKYYHLYVAKDIREPPSEAIIYGNALHKAAELHIREDIPLPKQFSFLQKYMDKVKAIPGNKLTEHKLGLRIENGKLVPCGFFDREVWFRGVIDLVSLDPIKGRAVILDYKTGKNSKYADMLQLELMAALTFMHFSYVHKIKAGLMFVVAKDFIQDEFVAKDKFRVFSKLDGDLERRKVAHETGVFNAVPNFSCNGWCPVTSCIHNKSR